MPQENLVLLLEDIDNVARKGEIVKVKPGFARNYLLPQKKAVVADKRTLRMQERLREERNKQAIHDKKESEEIAKKLEGRVYKKIVKVDPDGHMYGSVNIADIVSLLQEDGITIDKKFVRIGQAIRALGKHTIPLVLKEGVKVAFDLIIESDTPIKKKAEPAKKKQEETDQKQEPKKLEEEEK